MKNTLTISCVFAFVFFMILPAYAIEHQLGGFVRVRAFTAGDWSANDNDPGGNRSRVDSRSHLAYTAKINEDLTVYTELRMDSVFGGGRTTVEGVDENEISYGGSGISGVSEAWLKLKHSYIDFKINETNFLVGKQSFYEARGLLLYDAAPGIRIKCPVSDQLTIDAKWIKFGEGGQGGNAHQDVDTFAITPEIKLNDNIKIKPYFWYTTSRGMNNGEKTWNWWCSDINKFTDLDMYYLGFDFDASMGNTSIWFTTLYQAGSANVAEDNAQIWNGSGSVDFSGIVALGGGSLNLGKITLSGQLFYASGDDPNENDDKIEQFFSAEAGYYYWSEIMGLGSNDDAVPNNIGWSLSNIMGGGGTLSFCATDDISLNFGLWYAAAVEDFQKSPDDAPAYIVEADDYGTELNASMSYSLMENLSLSLIGAYVMAGDAMTEENVDGSNIEGADPYFVQAQIKASF
jgi:hypothetical protein